MTPTIEKAWESKERWLSRESHDNKTLSLPQPHMTLTPLKNATILAKHKQSQESKNA